MNSFDFTELLNILLTLMASLICITLHELSHGFVAYKLGDNTAKAQGRLTLNPVKHLDMTGFIMMLIFKVGWAKPVPVNMYNFKNPKRGMALVAVAGPLSNVLITAAFLFLYGALYVPIAGYTVGNYVLHFFELTAYISLGFAIFNLIPFPPLDGSKVLFSLMSDEKYAKLMHYEFIGGIVLIILMATNTLGYPIAVARQLLYNAMMGIAQFACDAVVLLFYI